MLIVSREEATAFYSLIYYLVISMQLKPLNSDFPLDFYMRILNLLRSRKLPLDAVIKRSVSLSVQSAFDSKTRTMSDEQRLAARNKPFIVICGCTGTGKTKLSIQLAEWLIQNGKRAEIINADAMQVKQKQDNPLNLKKFLPDFDLSTFKLYKDLDIITNKATDEEMKGIKHHLLGYLESTSISNMIGEYKVKAVELVIS
jgi:signal recognition particle GTPase